MAGILVGASVFVLVCTPLVVTMVIVPVSFAVSSLIELPIVSSTPALIIPLPRRLRKHLPHIIKRIRFGEPFVRALFLGVPSGANGTLDASRLVNSGTGTILTAFMSLLIRIVLAKDLPLHIVVHILFHTITLRLLIALLPIPITV